jgi:hypothetical protein
MSSKRIHGFKTADTIQYNYDPHVNILKMRFKVISFLRRIFGPVKENYGDAGITPTLNSNINNQNLSKKLQVEGWDGLGT